MGQETAKRNQHVQGGMSRLRLLIATGNTAKAAPNPSQISKSSKRRAAAMSTVSLAVVGTSLVAWQVYTRTTANTTNKVFDFVNI